MNCTYASIGIRSGRACTCCAQIATYLNIQKKAYFSKVLITRREAITLRRGSLDPGICERYTIHIYGLRLSSSPAFEGNSPIWFMLSPVSRLSLFLRRRCQRGSLRSTRPRPLPSVANPTTNSTRMAVSRCRR